MNAGASRKIRVDVLTHEAEPGSVIQRAEQ